MIIEKINKDWVFFPGKFDLFHYRENKDKTDSGYKKLILPHDFMIETDVKPEASAGPAMGYYEGGIGSYTKELFIPSEYEGEQIYLNFDGVMGYASIDVNGSLVTHHHYGYTPFAADITEYVDYGKTNKITVNVNASMQPSSRWYTGAGIYRSVSLMHGPKIHIANDGIFSHTDRITYTDNKASTAYVVTEVTIENHTAQRKIVDVSVAFSPRAKSDTECNAVTSHTENVTDGGNEADNINETNIGDITNSDGVLNTITRRDSVSIEANSSTVARIRTSINNPLLWDDRNPNLYDVTVNIEEIGSFTTRLIQTAEPMKDSLSTTFGIRMITTDSANGLMINNRPIKLKGGCVHHDNGILGAISLYDSEYRKILLHKENGYNAVRSAHNPPSSEFLRACDELGIYVIDEAFDSFEICKQPGDYGLLFNKLWKEDMRSFITRDRNHPSIIIWSTGNEIWERAGLGRGFDIATKLASYVRSLDASRPVTNAFCALWSGLCDDEQCNNPCDTNPSFMITRSEPFLNNLDVVGYNYLDNDYELSGKLHPERVIVGTESVPKLYDTIWANVMKHSFVIGDFTWTSMDYIGEAGLGKSVFCQKGNEEEIKQAVKALASSESPYPWRLAKDADFDINGCLLPQSGFRRVVWGDKGTYVFTSSPELYDMEEVVSFWGFNYVYPNWTYCGYEGKNLNVYVYSSAPKVALYLNGKLLDTKENDLDNHFTTIFDVKYTPGELTAVSLDNDGNEISSAKLKTAKEDAHIRLTPEKTTINADGESLSYVLVELVDSDGLLIQENDMLLHASLTNTGYGHATLAGFGSANPITDENYTSGSFTSYRGQCMAIIRSGTITEDTTLTVSAKGLSDAKIDLHII